MTQWPCNTCWKKTVLQEPGLQPRPGSGTQPKSFPLTSPNSFRSLPSPSTPGSAIRKNPLLHFRILRAGNCHFSRRNLIFPCSPSAVVSFTSSRTEVLFNGPSLPPGGGLHLSRLPGMKDTHGPQGSRRQRAGTCLLKAGCLEPGCTFPLKQRQNLRAGPSCPHVAPRG